MNGAPQSVDVARMIVFDLDAVFIQGKYEEREMFGGVFDDGEHHRREVRGRWLRNNFLQRRHCGEAKRLQAAREKPSKQQAGPWLHCKTMQWDMHVRKWASSCRMRQGRMTANSGSTQPDRHISDAGKSGPFTAIRSRRK